MDRISKIKQMLENDKTDSFLLFALAKEYEKLEDFEQAIIIFEKLKTSDAEYVGLYYHLAVIYNEIGKKEQAIKTCNQGIEVCKRTNDRHSLSELQNLGMNIEIE